MDPRQMVALRKMVGGDVAPPQAEEAHEQPPMLVQCPGCGEQFDANQAPAPSEGAPEEAV